jgi:hypothetical protein
MGCTGGVYFLRRQLELVHQLEVIEQALRDLGHGQHPVHHACGDRGTRHVAVLGLLRILGHGQSAALLDALDADGAIAVGSREHHGRRVRPVSVGQGAEEQIHRHVAASVVGHVLQLEPAIPDLQDVARRDHIDRVLLDRDRRGHLHHRHRGGALQQLGQHALVLGRQVQHNRESQARIRWQGTEEGAQGRDAASRPAKTDQRVQVITAAGDQVVFQIGFALFGLGAHLHHLCPLGECKRLCAAAASLEHVHQVSRAIAREVGLRLLDLGLRILTVKSRDSGQAPKQHLPFVQRAHAAPQSMLGGLGAHAPGFARRKRAQCGIGTEAASGRSPPRDRRRTRDR